MVGNKSADRITKVSKKSSWNNSETNENYKEIPQEKYVSPEERQKNYWINEIKKFVIQYTKSINWI